MAVLCFADVGFPGSVDVIRAAPQTTFPGLWEIKNHTERPTASLHRSRPHCQHQHPAKHEAQPDLHEPKAVKSPLLRNPPQLPEVLQANTVKLNDELILASC